jgi:hypothetical protein
MGASAIEADENAIVDRYPLRIFDSAFKALIVPVVTSINIALRINMLASTVIGIHEHTLRPSLLQPTRAVRIA